MILYVIQAHRDLEQLLTLLGHLHDANNFYILNLDPLLREEVPLLERLIREAGYENARVRIGPPVNWGGISQVYAMLDVMKFAHSLGASWEFMINLSGDCIPLVRQAVVQSFYHEELLANRRVHLSFFGPGIPAADHLLLRWGEAVGFDGRGETMDFFARLPAFVHVGTKTIWEDRARNPIFQWRLRGSVHVSDPIIEKRLVIRRLVPYEAAFRVKSLAGRLLHGGRAWYTISRSAVDELLTDPWTEELVHHLEHYLCPDEIFLQTYFRNSKRFRADEITTHHRRFRGGDAIQINDGMVDELFSSDAFFARKVRLATCPDIRERLNTTLGRQHVEPVSS